MRFLQPSVTFEGNVSLSQAPSADNHAVTKSYAFANFCSGIHTDSQSRLEMDATGKIKLKSLGITNVTTSNVANLAAFVSASYSAGNEFQEGDCIILTSANEIYIHNGGSSSDATDFTVIDNPLTDAEIRAKISGSAGVSYNSGSGVISADAGWLRTDGNVFTAGTALDNASGTLNVNQAAIRGWLSGSDGVAYNSSTGAISGDQAWVRGRISAGNGLSYNSSTGVYTADASWLQTDGNVFTAGTALDNASGTLNVNQAAIRGWLSASDGVAYNSSTGAISGDQAWTRGRMSGSDGVAYNSSTGVISGDQAWTRGRMSADSSAGNLLSYNASTGAMLVATSSLRFESSSLSLSANTWSTLTHNLGKKLVHVSAMDPSNGDAIQLEIQYTSTSQCKIKSQAAITIDVAVSL